MQHSVWYTLGFAAVVSLAASISVATTSVALRDRQYANRILDRQRKVLDVAGLLNDTQRLSPDEVRQRFQTAIRSFVVDLETGQPVDSIDPASFDQRERARDVATSRQVTPNSAGVGRMPNHALVYHVLDGGEVTALVLPIEGQGLWSTIYGYIALSPDLMVVLGITFYEHAETPGLGGEINTPSWRAKWVGRRPFGNDWEPRLEVIKGMAPPAAVAPYMIDGLSGATLTGRAVTNIVQFWLGENGFGPYLEQHRSEGGTDGSR